MEKPAANCLIPVIFNEGESYSVKYGDTLFPSKFSQGKLAVIYSFVINAPRYGYLANPLG